MDELSCSVVSVLNKGKSEKKKRMRLTLKVKCCQNKVSSCFAQAVVYAVTDYG
jgi:hypothetical protein